MSDTTTHDALLVRLRAAIARLIDEDDRDPLDEMLDEVADALANVRLDREQMQRQVESLRQQVIDAAIDRVHDAILAMAEDAMREAHRMAQDRSLLLADLRRARTQRQVAYEQRDHATGLLAAASSEDAAVALLDRLKRAMSQTVNDPNGGAPVCMNGLRTRTCERCGRDMSDGNTLTDPCQAIPPEQRWRRKTDAEREGDVAWLESLGLPAALWGMR